MTDSEELTGAETLEKHYANLPKVPLSDREDSWLYERYKLGSILIRNIQDDPDPRVPKAIERLSNQRQEILDEILSRGNEPPAQTISMKPIDWQVTSPGIGT